MQCYKDSKLSIFSDQNSSKITCSSLSIFSNASSTYTSESLDSSLILYQVEGENLVQSVIENEAYCFDVEAFSEKLVDAILVEATTKNSESNAGLTVFDVICPLIEFMLKKTFTKNPSTTQTELSQSNTGASLNRKLFSPPSIWPKISEFNIKLGQEQIEQFVETWKRSSDWLFCVEFLGFESEDCSNVFVYEVEWSKPTKSYPIPQATANVYFALEVYKMVPDDHDRVVEVSYVFECSNLIHKPGRIDFQEKWLQDILNEKLKIFKKLTFSMSKEPDEKVEELRKSISACVHRAAK